MERVLSAGLFLMGMLSGPLLAGGVAPLGEFEPSGSWVASADNEISFSKDGKNWDNSAFIGSTFWNTTYRWEFGGGALVLMAVDIVAGSFKITTPGTPLWTQNSGGDGPGQCQWIAHGAANWVIRTTTQLRTSSDGIVWSDQDDQIPTNWSACTGGQFKYSVVAGLYMAMGSTFNGIGFEDQYHTSSNRTSWTQRTFPADWEANGQGGNVDWLVESNNILLLGLQLSGDIYSSTDGINWTLRRTGTAILTGLAWNPDEGAFFAVYFDTNPDNLYSSSDGITWAAVDPNDLDDIIGSGQIACDTGKNLMLIQNTGNNVNYRTVDSAVSIDGGVTWHPRWNRAGRWLGFVPINIGQNINDSLTITPDPITISSITVSPAQSFARLIMRGDGTIDRQTSLGGIVQIGKWPAGAEDSLSPGGREYRLDQISGDTLNFGNTDVDTWVSANSQRLWGYNVAVGPDQLSGVFTLRVRDKITLVEDTNGGVGVTISALSTV